MLLEKFSNIIERSPVGAAVDYRKRLIQETDPNRIYIENISSFFSISYKLAQWLCDLAVKEGAFEKRIGVFCPNCEALLADFGEQEKLPYAVTCESCQMMDERNFEFKTSECRTIIFYRIIKNG